MLVVAACRAVLLRPWYQGLLLPGPLGAFEVRTIYLGVSMVWMASGGPSGGFLNVVPSSISRTVGSVHGAFYWRTRGGNWYCLI